MHPTTSLLSTTPDFLLWFAVLVSLVLFHKFLDLLMLYRKSPAGKEGGLSS